MSENIERQNQNLKPVSLTSKQAKDIASFVTSKFNEFKNSRAEKEKKWNECVKAFLSKHDYTLTDMRKWRSQIYIPLSYEAATNIYSNLKRAIFPTDSSFFTVEPKNHISKEFANIMKTFLLYQLDDMGFITKFGSFLKQLVVIGNSAAAVYWKHVTRKELQTVEVPVYDELGNLIDVKKENVEVDKVVYDGPEFETINMFDIVFDPARPDWQNGLVIHRSYRSYEHLKNNPVYKNIQDLKDSSVKQDDSNISEASKAFDMQKENAQQKNMVRLYSAYGDFVIDGKVYYDYIAVVANDEYLIRFEKNPYGEKPFVFTTYESVPNEPYGIGAIEPGLGIQYLVNTFSNQKADVLSLLINGMWAYVDDGIIDPEEIVARPGALIAVKDPNNIRPIHPDTSVALSYNEIAQLKAEYQEVTGATKYFTGGASLDFRKTATEVSALQSAGLVRFSEVIQNIEENALKRALYLVMTYNENLNYIEKLIHKEGKTDILPDSSGKKSFFQHLDLRIVGANSSISRDIRVNKLIEFLKVVSSNPVVAQNVNIMEIVRQLYRELGFKNDNNMFSPMA